MIKIDMKSVFLSQQSFQRGQQGFVTLDGPAALPAHQVMVMPFLGMVVDKLVVQFTFKNAAGPLQELQRAVDGGLVDTGHLFPDMFDDFLGGEMTFGIVDDIRNQYSLRGELEASGFQSTNATHRFCTRLQLYSKSDLLSRQLKND
jgi:hypothetical protein